ncbi:lamin tail domain-containing protein [Actinosynnema sp. NPDC050436]|uniref:lamin tail domain-containing protein n=1 Tax=Actinosynnema sp. NPDC050436 TaxID=3155659 RepID=UPI0033E479CE
MITFPHQAAALAVLCGLSFPPAQCPVKVHGVLAHGSTGYVELRNTSTAEVDLSGWTLVSCTGRATTILATLPAGTSLRPGAPLLVAGPDHLGPADWRVTVPEVSGDGQALLDRSGALVDRVAVAADSPCREAEAAATCPGGLALSRDEFGNDTDNNRRDFHCAEPPA